MATCPHALVDIVDIGLAVKRVSNGFAQMQVALPGLFGVVKRQVTDVHAGLFDQLDVLVFAGQIDISRVGELADMDSAGFQLQKAHRIFRDGAKHDFVQVGTAGFIPVSRRFGQDNTIVLDPFDKSKRAGPDGISQEFFGI